MAIKDRAIEIAYKLKDLFTPGTKKITGSLSKVERASNRSTGAITKNNSLAAKSFAQISGAVGKVKIALLGFFGVASAAAVKSTGDLIDYADQLEKLESRIGIAPRAMSALDYAASKSNVEFNTLSTALQRMTRRIAEAAKGTGVAKGALAELNLEAGHLSQLSPDQQFLAIADAMSKIPGAGDKVRIGMQLFDTEGVKLVQTMENGARGIESLMDEAERLGVVIGDDTAREAARFKDAVKEMETAATGLGRTIATNALPYLTDFVETLNIKINGPSSYLEEVREEIEGIEGAIKTLELRRDGFLSFLSDPEELNDDLEALQDRLDKLREIHDLLVDSDKEETRLREARSKGEEDYSKLLKKERGKQTKAVEDAYQARLRAYRDYLRDYRSLKEREKAIDSEFSAFVDEIRDGSGKDEPPDFIDASKAKFDAQQALNQGDFDGAIDKARRAADMVRELGDTGEYSTAELTGLAKMIQNVAVEASRQQSEVKLVDVETAKTDMENIRELYGDQAKLPVTIDQEALDASIQQAIDQAQAKLANAGLTVKVDAITEGMVDGVPTFTNVKVDQEAVKRSVGEAARQAQAEADRQPIIYRTVVDGVTTFSDTISTESRKRGTRPQ